MASPVSGVSSGLSPGLSSFVGRRREVTEVRRLVSTSHLVTLTGPGGVGKTRLAQEAASGLARQFRDGIVFVELEEVTDPSLVANTVAAAVGLREQAGRTPDEMLIDYLSSRQLLLVLDNSEHVIDVIASLADALLQGCPDLRILATSREWLDIPGEAVMAVPTLALPDGDLPTDDHDLLEYGAVRLFHDRAVSTVPGWALTDANSRHVAEICRRLDGLPLAIELATGWLRALSEKDLLAKLSDHLRLLSASRPGHGPTRPGSEPCAPASSGATACACRTSSCCGPGWRCSTAVSSSTSPRRWPRATACPRPAWSTRSRPWSTSPS